MSERKIFDAELYCHAETSCPAVTNIRAAVSWDRGQSLRVVYTLHGVVDRLRIPPLQPVRRGDFLWRHTCFELFVGAKNDAEYYELNFSPSGEWAAYEFRDYRDGGPLHADALEPKIAVQRGTEALELSAVLHTGRLPGVTPNICLSLGLSAVVEDLNGSLSYWALKHPPGKPDFHHADAFALELMVPG